MPEEDEQQNLYDTFLDYLSADELEELQNSFSDTATRSYNIEY